jgi:hypothetical protein
LKVGNRAACVGYQPKTDWHIKQCHTSAEVYSTKLQTSPSGVRVLTFCKNLFTKVRKIVKYFKQQLIFGDKRQKNEK